jgi:hypothetical protein
VAGLGMDKAGLLVFYRVFNPLRDVKLLYIRDRNLALRV